MKTRSIKELLIIVRRELRKDKAFDAGLCWINDSCVYSGLVTVYEGRKIDLFIHENMPISRYSSYGWKPGVKSPRLKWLTKEIEKR